MNSGELVGWWEKLKRVRIGSANISEYVTRCKTGRRQGWMRLPTEDKAPFVSPSAPLGMPY